VAIAPCCHHRCGWRAYTGKPYFRRLGFSPREFEVVAWMTGWALCGHSGPEEAPAGAAEATAAAADEAATGDGAGNSDGAAAAEEEREGDPLRGLGSMARRVALGRAGKLLIDAGRAEWLARRCAAAGGSACLLEYVDASVSGENRLLLGATARAAADAAAAAAAAAVVAAAAGPG
jgi:tRNA:m4X modification enzyme